MKRVLLIVLACMVPAAMLLGYWYRPGGGLPEIDDWDIATMHGQRIGRSHTTVTHASEGGRTLIKAAQSMQMTIKRYGEVTDMAIDCRDTETPDGRLIDFEAIVTVGGRLAKSSITAWNFKSNPRAKRCGRRSTGRWMRADSLRRCSRSAPRR
jgi:hypothetical protein